MLYVYLVLGCWLKYVFPEYGYYTDLAWLCVAWFVSFVYVLAAYLVHTNKVPKKRLSKAIVSMGPRDLVIIFGGILTGFTITSLVLLFVQTVFVCKAEKARKN